MSATVAFAWPCLRQQPAEGPANYALRALLSQQTRDFMAESSKDIKRFTVETRDNVTPTSFVYGLARRRAVKVAGPRAEVTKRATYPTNNECSLAACNSEHAPQPAPASVPLHSRRTTARDALEETTDKLASLADDEEAAEEIVDALKALVEVRVSNRACGGSESNSARLLSLLPPPPPPLLG